ncbi:MAG: acylneuraminate cytidylyltransferase family protein [Rhodothalassiaceae bacterium]
MSRTVAFVFARGQSKGIARKNLQPVGGIPLIAHSIRLARACERIDTVVVSTDDDEIAAVAQAEGAAVPFRRPDDLATDTAPEWLAWQHAVTATQAALGAFDIFLSLPPTAPLRAMQDVEAVLDALPGCDLVLTGQAARRHPAFNMVERDDTGLVTLASPRPGITRRQDAPPLFDLTTVAYATRPAFVMASTGPWQGRVRLVEIPEERAIDIDTPLDLVIANAVWEQYHA